LPGPADVGAGSRALGADINGETEHNEAQCFKHGESFSSSQ
jgi:hypothetical protein